MLTTIISYHSGNLRDLKIKHMEAPIGRIFACGSLIAGAYLVSCICPFIAPLIAGISIGTGKFGEEALKTLAGIASNVFATDIVSTIELSNFNPQANNDLRRAIGLSISSACLVESKRHKWLSESRRRCRSLAFTAARNWSSISKHNEFPALLPGEAIFHLTGSVAEGTNRTPPIFKDAQEWCHVFAELALVGASDFRLKMS